MDEFFSFGRWLRKRRKQLDLTQKDLAKHVGCAEGTIREIEAERRYPSVQVAEKLADNLDVPSEERDAFIRFARRVQGSKPPSLPVQLEGLPRSREPQQGVLDAPLPYNFIYGPDADFVGREGEIAKVVQAFKQTAADRSTTAICVIHGLAGVGKTQLARIIVKQLAHIFPSAQVLVQLHGKDAPLSPTTALRSLLRVFVPRTKLPEDLATLQQLYYQLVQHKHIIILADDALGDAQIKPLIPPPGSALLITSRQRFMLPGMLSIDLLILPKSEATRLLRKICPRIGKAAPRLARACGYLPLALRISATLLAIDDSRDIETYLKALERERLKNLILPGSFINPETSVEASLHLSYKHLSPEAQDTLRQLSVFVASFDRAAAQAVVDIPDTERFLLELRRHHLLEWNSDINHYFFHDLVREFAAAQLQDPYKVYLRYARHYVNVAKRASDLHQQGGENVLAGLMLFDNERPHIDAAWEWATGQIGNPEIDALLLDYESATSDIGELRYALQTERIPRQQQALAAARRLENREAEDRILTRLGWASTTLGNYTVAAAYCQQSLTIAQAINDQYGEGMALGVLGEIYHKLGKTEQAIKFHQQSLAIAQGINNRQSEMYALDNLGWAYYNLGEMQQAITYQERSLAVAQAIGSRRGEGFALGGLGQAYQKMGKTREALQYYKQSLAIIRDIGDQLDEANVLGMLGWTHALVGEVADAIACHTRCLTIMESTTTRWGVGYAAGNLGYVYAAMGSVDKAKSYFQQAIDIAREITDRSAEGYALGSLGWMSYMIGDIDQTIAYHNQSLAIAQDLKNRHGKALALRNLADASISQDNSEYVLDLCNQALEYAREFRDPYLVLQREVVSSRRGQYHTEGMVSSVGHPQSDPKRKPYPWILYSIRARYRNAI